MTTDRELEARLRIADRNVAFFPLQNERAIPNPSERMGPRRLVVVTYAVIAIAASIVVVIPGDSQSFPYSERSAPIVRRNSGRR